MKLFLLIAAAIFAAGCSVPKLEAAECSASRPALREFYSAHFGGDMLFSKERLEEKRRFLSERFYQSLTAATGDADPFTSVTADVPRAFRIGNCEKSAEGRTTFEVLLFWRDDARTEQRAIRVELERSGDSWLIDKVNN